MPMMTKCTPRTCTQQFPASPSHSLVLVDAILGGTDVLATGMLEGSPPFLAGGLGIGDVQPLHIVLVHLVSLKEMHGEGRLVFVIELGEAKVVGAIGELLRHRLQYADRQESCHRPEDVRHFTFGCIKRKTFDVQGRAGFRRQSVESHGGAISVSGIGHVVWEERHRSPQGIGMNGHTSDTTETGHACHHRKAGS